MTDWLARRPPHLRIRALYWLLNAVVVLALALFALRALI